MDSVRKVLMMTAGSFRRCAVNPRIYILALLVIMYVHMAVSPINTFCFNVGEPVSPWIFPFLMSDYYGLMIIMLGVIFLLCDAPFITAQQPYMLVRSGRTKWILSQVAYILISNALYFLFVMMVTIVFVLPSIEFSGEWGRVIGTFTQQKNVAAQNGIFITFRYSIQHLFTPAAAMLASYFFACLVGSFLGLLMFFLNLITTRAVGTLISAGLVLLEIFAPSFPFYLTYISPVSWASLAIVDFTGLTRNPSYIYVLALLFAAIAGLTAALVITFKHRNIDVLKSI